MKFLLLLTISLFVNSLSEAQIMAGTGNGIIGAGNLPIGWTGVNTPDLNNRYHFANFPTFIWDTAVTVNGQTSYQNINLPIPPTGDSLFEDIANEEITFTPGGLSLDIESISTPVQNLIVGKIYCLRMYLLTAILWVPPYLPIFYPTSVDVTIGGNTSTILLDQSTHAMWRPYSVSFIADSTSEMFTLGPARPLSGQGGGYVCISIAPNDIQVSSSNITQTICQGRSYLGYDTTGTYIDTFISAHGCDSIRMLNLIVEPSSYATVSRSICQGQSYLGYDSSGIYKDTLVSSTGCDSIRTLNLTVYQSPTVSVADSVLTIDRNSTGDRIIATVKPLTGINYSWNNNYNIDNVNNLTPIVYPLVDTYYTITVSLNALSTCIASATVYVDVLQPIQIPNVFSPNRDGMHDKWYIKGLERYPNAEVDVFNRWGQSIYQSQGNYLNGPWNGTYSGRPLPLGAYYYIIKLNSGVQADARPISGCVSIIY